MTAVAIAISVPLTLLSREASASDFLKTRMLARLLGDAGQLASTVATYRFGDPEFTPGDLEGEVDCRRGQPMPGIVTVLASNPGGTSMRSCEVPARTPLLFLVGGCLVVNGSLQEDCSNDPTVCDDLDFLGSPAVCGDEGRCIGAISVEEKVSGCEKFINDLICGLEVYYDHQLVHPVAGGAPLLRAVSDPTAGFFPNPFEGVDFDPELIYSGFFGLIPASEVTPGHHTLTWRGGIGFDDEGNCGAIATSEVTYELDVIRRW
ncbi:MAG: hypothetical protein ACFB9M_12400 [Myxococcota bacterium]